MARRKLIGMSLGVSDVTLTNIGRVVVLAATLDYRRMRLLEVTSSVPVAESAGWGRERLKDEIRASFGTPPMDRLSGRIKAWLAEVDNLLNLRDRYAHSITYHEVRGDGTSGSYIKHPKTGVVTAEPDAAAWEKLVMRMSDASFDGVGLDIEAGILRNHGAAAHDAHQRRLAECEASVEEMLNTPVEELSQLAASDTDMANGSAAAPS